VQPRRSNRWPFRQDDPEWADDVMWDRDKVIDVHRRYNGASIAAAEGLLRRHDAGNIIATEGCLLTCLAMVLRLLAPNREHWTPRTLNRWAKRHLYYSNAGLSMVPLYADIVADAANGRVQACMQEQYFSGVACRPAMFSSQCPIIRGYRLLPVNRRQDAVVMLKIGTHDDTFASHYVLVDPERPGMANEDDCAILDPDQPLGRRSVPWRLTDSHTRLARDHDIKREWRRLRIQPTQLSGVWLFACCRQQRGGR
jgi:hypothetical protein